MEEEEKRVDRPADDSQDGGEPKPIVRSITPVTRQLTTRTERAPIEARSSREQIAALVGALGDPTHPLHHEAVDGLVRIGDAAVPALNEALNPRRPWLTAYRATEALGQIGDGRSTGPLIEALNHPNSNVRWGAVRALAALGDARAILDLRRVARDDRGRTSWGEPIASAAQSALDQMRSQNVLLRSADLVKTAVACVVMLVALILAWSVITSLRAELARIGTDVVEAGATGPQLRTVAPTAAPSLPVQIQPSPAPLGTADVEATSTITGTVLTTGNVRALPSREQGERIGTVAVGDDVVFLASSPDGQWYRVTLGTRRSAGSQIDSADGSGWVIRTVVSPPAEPVPTEAAASPAIEAATPTP